MFSRVPCLPRVAVPLEHPCGQGVRGWCTLVPAALWGRGWKWSRSCTHPRAEGPRLGSSHGLLSPGLLPRQKALVLCHCVTHLGTRDPPHHLPNVPREESEPTASLWDKCLQTRPAPRCTRLSPPRSLHPERTHFLLQVPRRWKALKIAHFKLLKDMKPQSHSPEDDRGRRVPLPETQGWAVPIGK